MKIIEILNESSTDLVAKYYTEASKTFDDQYNPEAATSVRKNKEYYREYFKEWYQNGTTPVFEKPGKNTEPKYNHNPIGNSQQSPGYRGKQNALKAAGLPYNKDTQAYDPSAGPSGAADSLNV